MKCDQDLCLNFWHDFKMLLWQDELNPRVRCAFGNVLNISDFCLSLIFPHIFNFCFFIFSLSDIFPWTWAWLPMRVPKDQIWVAKWWRLSFACLKMFVACCGPWLLFFIKIVFVANILAKILDMFAFDNWQSRNFTKLKTSHLVSPLGRRLHGSTERGSSSTQEPAALTTSLGDT